MRATTAQAMDTTTALSRGGKAGLAASPGVVLEGKLAAGPTLPPQADGVGVKIDHRRGLDVGKGGGLVQQQDQLGALPQVGGRGAGGGESPRLGEELVGEGGAIARGRPRHEAAPWASGLVFCRGDALTLSLPRSSATLQLFVEWTT